MEYYPTDGAFITFITSYFARTAVVTKLILATLTLSNMLFESPNRAVHYQPGLADTAMSCSKMEIYKIQCFQCVLHLEVTIT